MKTETKMAIKMCVAIFAQEHLEQLWIASLLELLPAKKYTQRRKSKWNDTDKQQQPE